MVFDAVPHLLRAVCRRVMSAALVTGILVGPAPGFAQALSVEATAADPIAAAFTDLWGLVQAKCPLPTGRTWDVAIIGALPDNLALGADEKEWLALKLTSAASEFFREKSDARVRNYRELGDLIAVMGSGESREAVDTFLIDSRKDINLFVVIYGGRQFGRYRLALRAMGRQGLDCGEQTQPFDLPKGSLPEKVYEPDEFLSRAAQHVLERAHGQHRQRVWVKSTLADGQPAPEVWSESLARSFNRGVPMARDRLPSRSLEFNDVHAEAAINYSEPRDWTTRLVVDPNARDGAYVEVEVQPPEGDDTDGVSFDGLVDREKLPPLPSSATAEGLPLSTEAPRRFEVTLGGRTRRREFPFSLPRRMVVEVDLGDVTGANAPSVGVLDHKGTVLRNENQSPRVRPYLQQWRLPAGRYSLWLQARSNEAQSFTVRTRAAFDALVPESVADVGSIAGDWVVVRRELPDGSRRCSAFTPAVAIEPADWRLELPTLAFQMHSNSDEVVQKFDMASAWRDPSRVEAQVQVRDHWEYVPLDADTDGTLKSLEPCRSAVGETCLRADTMRQLTIGRRLQLSGVTAKGASALLQYSLTGYQAAMFAMARLCDRQEYAAALVLRR